MPAAQPPHRSLPDCPVEERAGLVNLAIAGEPGLVCDRRELQRPGPSYTFDSLQELRAELGGDVSLCLIVGIDALLGFESWHRWREVSGLAHVIAVTRPGWQQPSEGAVAEWMLPRLTREIAAIQERAAGAVLVIHTRPMDISSTEIRELIASGKSPRYLLPDAVWDRIKSAGLYGYQSTNQEKNGIDAT